MYRMGMPTFQYRVFDDDSIFSLSVLEMTQKVIMIFQIFKLQKKDWFIAKITVLNNAKAKKINAT